LVVKRGGWWGRRARDRHATWCRRRRSC